MSYLMDQSRGRIPPERKGQEMTSSDPAPSRCSLGVPDSGTWRQGGGGLNVTEAHYWNGTICVVYDAVYVFSLLLYIC